MIIEPGPIVQVNLAAVVDNWRALRDLSPSAETGAVVKANGYGLGMTQVASALGDAGCRYFFTAYAEEALALRRHLGPTPRIICFHGPRQQTVTDIVSGDITPVLNSLSQVRLWAESGAPHGVMLNFDTGMNRLGLSNHDAAEVRAILPNSSVEWIMSHLACADEPAHEKNQIQRQQFELIASLWPHAGRSLSNTAGVCLGPSYHYDLTRPGIGLYGGSSGPGFSPRPVASVTAPILRILDAPEGDVPSIGYGAEAQFTQGMVVAIVSIGYADGLHRTLWPGGFGVVNGARCPVIGRVSMDLTAVDITKAVKKGGSAPREMDRVEFLGQNANVQKQAEAAGTISYELLTSIGPRVRRLYEDTFPSGERI